MRNAPPRCSFGGLVTVWLLASLPPSVAPALPCDSDGPFGTAIGAAPSPSAVGDAPPSSLRLLLTALLDALLTAPMPPALPFSGGRRLIAP